MRPPEEVRREQVRQWVAKADQDRALIRFLLENRSPFYSAIGFHAQQAVEKYLKALLTRHHIEFPKSHSITRLLTLLAGSDPELADSLADTEILSAYAVESRYPGDLPNLSEKEALEAQILADRTRQCVLARLDIQDDESKEIR